MAILCMECGTTNLDGSKFCKNCGSILEINASNTSNDIVDVESKTVESTIEEDNNYNENVYFNNVYSEVSGPNKSPFIAVFLSLIIPGLGYVYLGNVRKFVMYLIIMFLLFSIPFILSLLVILVYFYQLYAVYRDTKLVNEGTY